MKEVINMFKLASYSLSILGSALSLKVHFLWLSNKWNESRNKCSQIY
jgi:hypothetical protein